MDLTRLKQEFNARPLEAIAVATAAVLATTKVVDTIAGARSKNAYAKQIKRKNSKKK